MNRLLIACSAILVGSLGANAQAGQGLLEPENSVAFFREAITEPHEWVPYPTLGDTNEWQALLPPAKQAALIENAEEYQGYNWPVGKASLFLEYVQNGNRSRYQAVHFARRQALTSLVMGELVEDKGRFIGDIVNGIWAISEETFWGVPAHLSPQEKGIGLGDVNDPVVDLFAAETAQILAWSSYLLAERLDAVHTLIRERIYTEIDRRIFRVIERRPEYRWMGTRRKIDDPTLSYERRSFLERRPNNWNPWINSNLLTCILLLEQDPQRRAGFVHQVLEYLDNYLEPHPADGGSDEGTSYWGHAAASTFDSIDLIRMATRGRFDRFDRPLIRNMGEFITRAYVGNGFFINFADAKPRSRHSPMLVYRFGKAVDSAAMMGMGAYLAEQAGFEAAVPGSRSLMRNLPELFYTRELLGVESVEPLPGEAWLPDIQLMVSRDSPGSTHGLFIAAKAGHNEESHNHNDVGSFMVYKDSYPAIIDVGGATYTRNYGNEWVRESAFHNLLPMIDGQGQKKGMKYSARNVGFKPSGREVVFSQDFSGAYHESAGVIKWEREYRHVKGQSVVVSDLFEFDTVPGSVSLPMMFNVEPDLSVAGQMAVTLDGKAISLTVGYDAAQFDVRVEKITVEDRNIAGTWGDVLYRVHFKMKQPSRSGQFRFLIE